MLGFSSLDLRLVEKRRWVVHMVLSWRLRRGEAEDGRVNAMGYVGPFYPKIVIFYVLDPRGNLVF
jgi:hypothetical protein